MDRYQENDKKRNDFIKISKLYKDKKYEMVIKQATTFLNEYPNHIAIRFMRAKSYRILGFFNEGMSDLKYILNEKYNEHAIVELFYIYYHLNMYKDAMELLPVLYQYKLIKPISLYLMETIMRKQLGMELLPQNYNCEEYFKNQIISFDKDKALDHISIHTDLKISNKDRSKFNEGIDIKYLYEIVQENIDHSKKINCEETLEIHYFAIPNIGVYNDQMCSCIKVALIPNTLDIMALYPTTKCNTDEFLNYDRDKLFPKEKEKIKRMSRIDRFKNRYKI